VTGAGSGIGRAACLRLAEEGARVCALDVDADSAAAVAAECDGVALVADVADSGVLDAAFTAGADRLDGLDLVFNNAGIGAVKSLHRYGDDEWDRLVGVNLRGTFNGIRAAVPLLRAAGGGSIVNMSSLSGIRPTRGEGPYSAAKAGVIALTQSAALEYGPEIRVNCVSPGFIETPLTARALRDPAARERIESGIPLRRVGEAGEVANVVVFLCSSLSSYVTGANITIDGGSLLPSAQSDRFLADLLARIDAASDG